MHLSKTPSWCQTIASYDYATRFKEEKILGPALRNIPSQNTNPTRSCHRLAPKIPPTKPRLAQKRPQKSFPRFHPKNLAKPNNPNTRSQHILIISVAIRKSSSALILRSVAQFLRLASATFLRRRPHTWTVSQCYNPHHLCCILVISVSETMVSFWGRPRGWTVSH